MRIVRSLLAAALFAITIAATAPTRAGAESPYAEGTTGYDVSWPQCDRPMPPLPFSFVIIGVTGGRALTLNPCLDALYAWAVRSLGKQPTFYVNMKFPSGSTESVGMTGPAGICTASDLRCQASNYGYKTAEHAVAIAPPGGSAMWWLDVETVSTWSADVTLNTLVIRAAIDYFRAHSLAVGLYSTASQWKQITGDYRAELPVWSAGATSGTSAPSQCRTGGFGGGQVVMVQYLSGEFDADYVCRQSDFVAPVATPIATPSPTSVVSPSGAIPLTGGFGIGVFSGGSAEALVTASGCPRATAAFYLAFNGELMSYVPAAPAVVNAPFLVAYPGGQLPKDTAFVGRCK